MRFAILGTLAVTHEGRSLPVNGPITRRLLAALLVNPNQVVPDQWLADQVWGGTDDDGWKNRLETAVSRLGSMLSGTDGDRRIVRDGVGYRLVVGEGELDAHVFERLLRAADKALAQGDAEQAVELADRALAEWRGRAFGELAPEAFAYQRAYALDANRLIAQQIRVDGLLQLGRHAEVVPDVEALVATEPGNEHLLALLLTALYRGGRHDEALGVYHGYQADLDKRGRRPGAELAELERRMLGHDPSLDWRPVPGDPVDAGGSRSSGLHTFLFSGLDDSPGGGDREPAAAAGEVHESAVGTAIATRGGRVFGRAGLGFCAVFERPIDAVLAAGDAALAMHRAASHGSLRAQLAVHTGEASRRGQSFAGPAITRVARIRDAGHGGRVLVSAATRELVADELPPKLQLVGIGAWQFDGLSHSERLYQLAHDGLDAEFPPLQAGLRHTGQLPRYTTPFLGREREVTDAANKLQRQTVVTITGDGGIGKTRLALEVAQRARITEYPDGVWHCDVSLADDADTLVERLAAARGLVLVPDSDHRRDLVRSFEGARLLFVLDGCERLRGHVAEIVGDVLESGSQARLLVTSRARLGLPAEQVVKLDPLPVPGPRDPEPETAPAVQLLRDLAGRSGATVAQADPHLVELARRLDGLPLAIELAAPLLASISASTLVDRLDVSFETLTGPPGAPARHRTLRATFDWSFDLLSPAARSLFAALSLFRGTWSIETAEAVATAVDVDPDQVMALTAELVDQSLIRVDMPTGGAARHTMLDTIRAYAAEHLAQAGRYDAVADLHATHFLDLATRAMDHRRGPDEAAWVGKLQAEFDDLRATHRHFVDTKRPVEGLRLVVALADDLLMRERLEIERWATELAAVPAVADEPLRAEALALAANASMMRGRLNEAHERALTALEVEAATGAPESWIARNVLAMVTVAGTADGDWRVHHDAMDAISDATGDPFPRAVALWNRAVVATYQGKADRAETPARDLRALGEKHDNPSMRAMGLVMLGRVAALRHEIEAARDLFHQALGAAEAAHTTLVINRTMRELADLDAGAGDHTAALKTLRRIGQTFTESGNVSEQVETVMSMVEQLVALGELPPAAMALGALSRTWMAETARYKVIAAIVAERLDPATRLAAHRKGSALELRDLIAELMRALDDLGGEER